MVAKVHNGIMHSGVHDMVWDAGGLSNGVYLLRATYGQSVITMPVTLVK
jgi:hypothetical protein